MYPRLVTPVLDNSGRIPKRTCYSQFTHIQPGNKRVFPNLNAVYCSILFTMELETSGCMRFSDVLVKRCESGGIVIRTYRKPTHTGLYSKRSSFVPWHYKRNFV